MTSLVTSSAWKYFFLDYLHTIVPYPMSNCGYLWKFSKSWNFHKWQNFEVQTNFFVGSVTGNWVSYIDSQVHYLHFELLIDSVAQILTSYGNFKIWPTFWPRDPIIWPSTYIINGFLGLTKIHVWVKFGDDWSNGATCILLTTFRTDKQTKKQSEIAYLPKFPNWW